MAAIEKVCEFSGEYPGWEMYGFKRNHIQVMPKHRKEFRGQKATLYITKGRDVVQFKCGATMSEDFSCINPNPTDADWDSGKAYRYCECVNGIKTWYVQFFDNVQQYKAALAENNLRLLTEYDYILYVPGVPGEVAGRYMNSSTDMSSVLRRLKRLVGTRNLTVKYCEEPDYAIYEQLAEHGCLVREKV